MGVPEDVSIIGFDDNRFAAVCEPPLTTIEQPAKLIGERAMRQLCRAVEHGPEATNELSFVPYRLVVRESVAAPAADS